MISIQNYGIDDQTSYRTYGSQNHSTHQCQGKNLLDDIEEDLCYNLYAFVT